MKKVINNFCQVFENNIFSNLNLDHFQAIKKNCNKNTDDFERKKKSGCEGKIVQYSIQYFKK